VRVWAERARPSAVRAHVAEQGCRTAAAGRVSPRCTGADNAGFFQLLLQRPVAFQGGPGSIAMSPKHRHGLAPASGALAPHWRWHDKSNSLPLSPRSCAPVRTVHAWPWRCAGYRAQRRAVKLQSPRLAHKSKPCEAVAPAREGPFQRNAVVTNASCRSSADVVAVQ
jgi:hypothetical protein